MAYIAGEILLIVIGILIALAINNRSEDQLIRQKEQVYLAGLQEEFQVNHAKLQELLKVNRSNYERARRIIGYIDHPEALSGEAELSRLLYHSTEINRVVAHKL